MEEAVTALLLADAGLTALVGNRIHWMRLPQSVEGMPYVNLQTVSGIRDYHMGGPSGLTQHRLQVDAWGASYGSAKAAARAAAAVLSGHRGTTLRGGFIDSERDFADADSGDVNRLFRTSFDIMIWSAE